MTIDTLLKKKRIWIAKEGRYIVAPKDYRQFVEDLVASEIKKARIEELESVKVWQPMKGILERLEELKGKDGTH